MVASTTPRPRPSRALARALQEFSPSLPLAVAFSGGADSTALLLACADRWPGQVQAFHVHHGLQAAADLFEAHCRSLCQALQVPLQVWHVQARPGPGQSPEDAARRARYQAFDAWVQQSREKLATDSGAKGALPVKSVALAQHADDQVETLLLALGRGAGLGGLSAMPGVWQRGGATYHRPLLRVHGADLREWLLACGVKWVEDPTNTDTRYTRNLVRAELLPALAHVFPQFRETFARSARHAAQAQTLLDDLARIDLTQVGMPPVIKSLQALSPERQANALRAWLRQAHDVQPSTAQLQELLSQIAACTTRGHRIQIKVGRGVVARQGDQLHWYNPAVLPR